MAAANVADRNFLFGILALQMDFITRDQMVAAMHAWVLDKPKGLGSILVEQGALSPSNHDLLAPLVDAHIRQHNNDPQQSLAAISPLSPLGPGAGGEGRSLHDCLHDLADADVQASLAAVGRDKPDEDPSATKPYIAATSDSKLRFRILRPHAEGGLGKISVARDQELSREVALKEIKERYAHDADSRARFLREAEITGGLEHPGIVPVYSLGSYADGRPFYAMRFIRGESLWDAIKAFHRMSNADFADERREALRDNPRNLRFDFSSLEFRQLLGRFVDVCQAIQYAHDRGVLHRDLKPGNIMLGKYGETLVVDWGLAKARGVVERTPGTSEPPIEARPESDSATQPGKALGTPAFMSPEQAAGQHDQLGPSSDVYSLGATLYCLLTGHPPIEHADTGEMLRRVQRGEYRRPREISLHIDPALEAICLTAMAMKQTKRYVGAKELAGDVEHWLADVPVSAWPEPWTVKGRRFVGRHRVAMTGAAAALFVAVIGSITANVLLSEANETISKREQEARAAGEETKLAYVKLEKEQQESERARIAAQKSAKEASERAEAEKKAKDESEDNLATATMQVARSRFEESNAGLADELLEKVPKKLRDSAWGLIKNEVAGSPITLRGHHQTVTCVAFSPDGQIVVSGCADNTVKFWDARTGQEIRTITGRSDHDNRVAWDGVFSLAFSPDGQLLASGYRDNTVTIWDARTGREIRTLAHEGLTPDITMNGIWSLAFSPNGQVLASASGDKTIKLWDPLTGQEIRTLQRHKHWVRSVSFSPDGRMLASVSQDKTLRVWDARTGMEIHILRRRQTLTPSLHEAGEAAVAFSPDGQLLASGSTDNSVRLWDAHTGKEIRTLQGGVESLAFSPDGQVLACGGGSTVKLWDARTGEEIKTIRGHHRAVWSVAFRPDGQVLATGSGDKTVKLWDTRTKQEIRTLGGHVKPVLMAAFSPDGQVLASACMDKVQLWDTSSMAPPSPASCSKTAAGRRRGWWCARNRPWTSRRTVGRSARRPFSCIKARKMYLLWLNGKDRLRAKAKRNTIQNETIAPRQVFTFPQGFPRAWRKALRHKRLQNWAVCGSR